MVVPETSRWEQVAGLPVVRVKIDRAKIARYGINASEVIAAIEAAVIGGLVMSTALTLLVLPTVYAWIEA